MTVNDPIARAVAAATHTRVQLFRERTLDEIDEDLRGFDELTEPEDRGAVHDAAIEMLAMLEPDELDRVAALVRERREP